jgi:SAM-dependent methyltransferase
VEILGLYEAMEDDGYLQSAERRGRSNARQVRALLDELGSHPRAAIEIGAGSGYLVRELSNSIPVVAGVEPSRSFCEWAQQHLGLQLINSGYEELVVEPSWDLVVALDVIEHVSDPGDFVATVGRLLAPGGVAIIGTPDAGSRVARLMGRRWWHIRPPHLYYFNRDAIAELAARAGLRLRLIKGFHWSLSLGYLVDSVLKLLVGRSPGWIAKLDIPVRVNTFDSMLVVMERPA